ncbi:MAG TPA: SDR family NAD(P)-dependent oxidoreductase, partial [Pyrinomonadaceae bacterium]|nr:SDR family NAD(P)-dependent oxidoreductase [Pyrinomonadaceae bacterium]
IPLPTYPFARERYWLPTSENTVVSSAVARLHPLIDANTSDLEEQKFTTRFTGNEFFLSDHVIKGSKLLPGVAVLEMARAAGELAAKRPVLTITNTTWNSAIAFAPDRENEIQISLYPAAGVDDVEYHVWSSRPGGSREVHAQGMLAFAGHASDPESLDVKAVVERCVDRIEGAECYRQFHEHGFSYGNSFRSIQELHFNSTEAIARLQLPDGLEPEFRSFSYHPSLLDGALQTVLGLLRTPDDDGRQIYLPFSLGAIEQHQPLSQTVYAYVQSLSAQEAEGIRKFDISIVDEAGGRLLTIRDFTVKSLGSVIAKQTDDDQVQPSECLLYYPDWKTKPIAKTEIAAPANGSPEVVLVFDTVADIADAIAGRLSSADVAIRPILVKPGDTFSALDNDSYLVNPAAKDDYEQLFAELNKRKLHPARILHLWSCRSNSTDLPEQLNVGFRSVFNLTQTLMQQKPSGWVGLLYVHPDRQPAFDAVSALAKTVRLENPKFLYRSLAVKAPEFDSQIDNVLNEFQNGSEVEVRYDGNERQIRVWTEYTSGSDLQRPALKDDGVYLITGGAGGLGQIFLEHFTRTTKARFVLAGRSELSAGKEAVLRALDNSGERIVYEQADVSHREEVESLIARIKSRFGVINGVFHAAGVTRDAFVLNKSDEEIATVLAPKVYGTQWLDEVTATDPLEFFVIFSSAAGALGNIGQSDYAFANSFADHFSHRREDLCKQGKHSGKTLSINWPLWEEGGLQTSGSSRDWMRQTLGLVPLESEDGLKAFDLSLQSPHAQLMVLAGERRKISNAVTGSPIDTQQVEARSIVSTPAVTDDEELTQQVDAYLKKILSTELKLSVDKISSREPLEQYGIDSVVVMNLTRELEKQFGELSKTLFFEYRTITELTRYFIKHHRNAVEQVTNSKTKHAAAVQPHATMQQVAEVKRARFQRSKLHSVTTPIENDDIAIVGLSGRYPMANDLAQFWENLKSGKDCITEVPAERWSANGSKQWGGFLDDADSFDSLFFNISPKEAKLMDPQERLFLETVWHTLEDAGYTRQSLEGIATGVFVGVMYGHYQLFSIDDRYKGTGYTPSSLHASIANRISYVLNLQGPSIALDTMCSSSLTAIHLACASLRQGDCEVAIAGGVNLSVHPNKYLALNEAKFTSTDGRCRTFGAGGDGYVPGEGVGALMLKRLNEAVGDGDHVYGVIKGSAINHGGRTNGYTVPNPTAQAAVIARALELSHVDPRRISYLEAHGTGTSLGDPIEITGLVKAFSDSAANESIGKQYCSIGSVKSNIGHLESAAGIAGITKVLLQMKYRQLVPSLHSTELNPHINFKGSPFFVQQKLEPWKNSESVSTESGREYPRQAGISSFGAGGSNAHIIIEEFLSEELPSVSTNEPQFITLSAQNEERLRVYAASLAEFINKQFHPSKSSLPLNQNIGQQVEDQLRSIAADILNLDSAEIDPAEALSSYGADPICFSTLTDRLNRHYDVEINPAVFPELPPLKAVAEHLVNEHGPAVQRHHSASGPTAEEEPATELTLRDLAYTLQVGREAMEERLALVVTSVAELGEKLSRYAQGEQNIDGMYTGNVRQSKQRSELLLEGREGVEFVQTVIEQRKWQKLAQLWLLGVDVDWRLLYHNVDGSQHARRRVSLPGYPFARVRHWLPQSGVVQQQVRKDLHPLVEGIDVKQTFQQNRQIIFYKTLRASDPVIKDHVVLQRTILPGVG